jgi:protease-4
LTFIRLKPTTSMKFLSTLFASLLGTLLALGLLFFMFFLLLLGLASSSEQTPTVRTGSVLVVPFDGVIPEAVSGDPVRQAFADEPSYDLSDLREALRKAAADRRIAAVWLKLRGVEASWSTLHEVRQALLDFRKSSKPLYASSNDYIMGEAEYYLASAADSVFAGPNAPFEFNGFAITAEFYKRLLDKLDVEPQVIRAGRYKSAVEPYLREDLSPENEEQLAALLATINRHFLEAVAERRGLTPEGLGQLLATRALVSVEDAHREKLVDSLLFDEQVADVLKQRLGIAASDDLEETSLRAYVRIPAQEAGLSTGNAGEVAVVYAVGTIMNGKSSNERTPFGDNTLGSATFADAMAEARENERIKAVVVRINSPGGFAPAADVMWQAIDRTAAEKPVLVSMGDVAASGGYWMAAAADTIVADPLTITGSIGVFSVFFNTQGLFENKLGITFDAVRTSPYADMFSGVRPLTEAERTLMQTSTDQTYQTFLQKVAEGRRMTPAQVDSLGQGRVWAGEQARQNGLVDVLGNLDTTIRLAATKAGLEEGTYRVRELPRPATFLEELNETLNARITAAWQHLRTSAAERTLLAQARTLKRLLAEQGTVQARMLLDIRIR